MFSTVTAADQTASRSPRRTTVCSALHESPPVRYDSSAAALPRLPSSSTASSVGRSESRAAGVASRTASTAPRASVESEPSSARTTSHEPSLATSVPSVTRSPRELTLTRRPTAFSRKASPLATSQR